MRLAYQELFDTLRGVLLRLHVPPERAERCARLFADASRDGVPSHGLNLFPRFVATIRSGTVDVAARARRTASNGAFERWDGRGGIGNLNAWDGMARAIGLAREHGIGCVALANTNHWGRGGNFGWQAADAGVVGICWTNTLPNLPPWGADDPRIGNNPLVMAVPRPSGHIVLDMALSQFSFGALASYRMRGELLPVPGGFDTAGELTRDPAAIEASGRPLPIGYWKGSGLSILLDMIAALASGGRATHEVQRHPEKETGLSQVFIALDAGSDASHVVDRVVASLSVRYPGQRTLETRARSLAEGIPVEPSIWERVRNLNFEV